MTSGPGAIRAFPPPADTGGHNNGVSSGILKTVDGGVHWTRNSKGMWDTRINGVWLHPDDPQVSARPLVAST